MDKIDKGFILFLVCAISFLIWYPTTTSYFASMDTAIFCNSLEEKGLIVTMGNIESPSVIIDVDGIRFKQLIIELNVKEVYVEGNIFYVFNSEMTIAYRYVIPQRHW